MNIIAYPRRATPIRGLRIAHMAPIVRGGNHDRPGRFRTAAIAHRMCSGYGTIKGVGEWRYNNARPV
jgi:hypothetical protein